MRKERVAFEQPGMPEKANRKVVQMKMTIGVGADEKDGWVDPWLLKHASYHQAGY